MKRLTMRNSDGTVSQPIDLCWADALYRLAAYEDTGLEPEEVKDLQLEVATLKTIEVMYDGLGRPDHLRELVEAEKDGRLVLLPFEIGDIVYYIDFQNRIRWTTVARFVVGDGVHVIGCCGEDIGDSGFSTREEAEAALEAQKEGGEK